MSGTSPSPTIAAAGSPQARARPLKEDVSGGSLKRPVFVKSLGEAQETLARRLDDLLRDGRDDSVHDARTAIRRLEARIDLLPKKARKSAEVEELLRRCDRVMKRSADVRDLDVIRSKVARYKKDPAKPELLKRIDKRRKRSLKAVKDAAAKSRKAKVPPGALESVTQAGLQKRLEKVVARLAGKIWELLPVVARDPKKLDELHRLRIDGKKLRYTLELTMDERSPALQRLKKWQDSLGNIHDLDVMASFLRKFMSPLTRELLKEALAERDREFNEFSASVLHER